MKDKQQAEPKKPVTVFHGFWSNLEMSDLIRDLQRTTKRTKSSILTEALELGLKKIKRG